MKPMEFDATLKKNESYLTGVLIYSSDGAINEKPFKYRIDRSRTYSIEQSLIGAENIVPTQTIIVQDITIPFAKGHKVKIYEGAHAKEMRVESAEFITNDKKAHLTGDPRVAQRIFLKGG